MRQLWAYRFKKLIKTEEQGLRDYDVLIEKLESTLEDSKSIELIKKIRQDEMVHCDLMRELLAIVEKPDPSEKKMS